MVSARVGFLLEDSQQGLREGEIHSELVTVSETGLGGMGIN